MLETFALPSFTADSDVYVRVFNAAREVLDFDDGTFKSLSAATEPYKVCTEREDGDGTGFSDYTVELDLAAFNSLPTVERFHLKFYAAESPADADVAISSALDVTVQAGRLGERAVVAHAISNVKSTQGLALQIAAWLELEGETFDVATAGGTTFTADAGTDVITSSEHGLEDGQAVLVASDDALPAGLAASTVYYVRDATTNTFKLAEESGGSAVDVTSAGSGVHRWLRPTCRVTLREHGTELATVEATVGPERLVNDGETPAELSGDPLFEFEFAEPALTDDRSYDVECTVTLTRDGETFSWTTHAREVVIG